MLDEPSVIFLRDGPGNFYLYHFRSLSFLMS
jgi:hypothetical protein